MKNLIENTLGASIRAIKPVSGGDICKAYRIDIAGVAYFVKLLEATDAYAALEREQEGLLLLKQGGARIPEIKACIPLRPSAACLVMEWVPPAQGSRDLGQLGRMLAEVHQSTSSHFGLSQDNYIGRLKQHNEPTTSWSEFWVMSRLLPQIKIARDKGLLPPSEEVGADHLHRVVADLMPSMVPSLLHGDLWSGNYIMREDGQAILIDPAVYYGHKEVDLAMTRLFGGFGSTFYDAYHDVWPLLPGHKARCDIYQLYYLLVHLNLFGASYYPSVRSVLRRYFR